MTARTVRALSGAVFSGALFLGCLLTAWWLPTSRALAVDPGAAVQCYNEALGTVQETLARDCQGEIVSEEQAEALRKDRRKYIQKLLSDPAASKVPGKRLTGTGSGFFVSANGSVITNHHVIDGCAAVSISPTFGEMVLASEVVSDKKSDLALLRADVVPPAVASLAADVQTVGLGPAYVVGYPNRGLVTIEPILSAVEILNTKGRTKQGPAVVVRGDIRQGNSGGPLLDSGGSVLGVIFAKVNSVNVYEATGQIVRDVAMAVPSETVQSFLEAHDVDFRRSMRRPPQLAERILSDTRPFLARVGCWK